MKRTIYFVSTLALLLMWSSCRKDIDFEINTTTLEFSKDTVYLDTVFTNIGSSTYNLKVYNRSNKNITIPSLRLQNGDNSFYRLNVDGRTGTNGQGKQFENVEILAKDSMFIFIETTIDIGTLTNTATQYLYEDKIEFDSGDIKQDVDLITLVKDAMFIFPDRNNTTRVIETLTINISGEPVETEIQGRFLLPEELTFTNEKPYVIYGYAAVPEGEILTIEAGSRIHFHANSGIIVPENSSLNINGALSLDQDLLENQVILEGDRLESSFSDVPGQWGTIWLFDGSLNNSINYATIKNASVGILSDGNANDNKLTITNSQIYNSSNYGILGRNTSITGENLVINNSGQSSFAGTFGGSYNFTHCTIANYWNNSFRQFPSVLLNNFLLDEENNAFLADLTEANFNNCIIYGNDNPEILLDELEDVAVAFNFKFTNCLIRFEDNSNNFSGPNYNLEDSNHYESNLFNLEPDFKDPFTNQLIIGQDSRAINEGNSIFATQVPFDILNNNRTANPDLGAYQHTTFEE